MNYAYGIMNNKTIKLNYMSYYESHVCESAAQGKTIKIISGINFPGP